MVKSLTREELVAWIENSKLPLKLAVIQLAPDLLVIRRMTEKNQGLTVQQEIVLNDFFDG